MANDDTKPTAKNSVFDQSVISAFSAKTVELDAAAPPIDEIEAEEVLIDRTAFGFDPVQEETIDAEIETPPVPMQIKPVPMKYAAAVAMTLGVLGLFVGRQLTDSGPAQSMASIDAGPVVIEDKTFDRTAGETYMRYADAATRQDAEQLAAQLWGLGIETTIETDVPATDGYAIVGTIGFDLVNGLPGNVKRHMPEVVNAGFNPEPIHWPDEER